MILINPNLISHKKLNDLLQQLVDTLPSLPGFHTLSLFGSVAEGRADDYSDLDLLVTTDDLDAAKAQLFGLLETIGHIEFCWVLSLRPDEWNPTIVFVDKGYYHKLDLGLVAADAENRTIPDEQTRLLVEGNAWKSHAGLRQSQAYMPPAGSVGHFLLGQYLGGTRYVKARKRGHTATCYRFVTAAADWCMRACYAHLTGDSALHAKLSTPEYLTLDALLTPEHRSRLFDALNYSNATAMDQALCAIFAQLTCYCQAIASATGEALPMELFQQMQTFFVRELGIAENAVIPNS